MYNAFFLSKNNQWTYRNETKNKNVAFKHLTKNYIGMQVKTVNFIYIIA